MIDSEIPVLKKEDLITILEALFKFSQEQNNAITRKDDGLYVLDFYNTFKEHVDDSSIHTNATQNDILKDFSIINGVLNYKNTPISINVSQVSDNAIKSTSNGLYAKDLETDFNNHINNNEIHITQAERDTWNSILQISKDYIDSMINNLIIYDYQIVSELPSDTASISETTVYLIKSTFNESNEDFYVRYIYRNQKWIQLDLSLKTYDLFAIIKNIQDNYVNKTDYHEHDNKDVLDKLSIDNTNDRLLFNGVDILADTQISDDSGNAIFVGSDGKLYVKDLESELSSLKRNSNLSKTILLDQECNSSGIYYLEENIDEYNYLMICYYIMPDDTTLQPYDARMEMLDVDVLNDLYNKNIDYIVRHDYGISTYNSKIRFYSNKMQILYYNHVCIYKIIGVK